MKIKNNSTKSPSKWENQRTVQLNWQSLKNNKALTAKQNKKNPKGQLITIELGKTKGSQERGETNENQGIDQNLQSKLENRPKPP